MQCCEINHTPEQHPVTAVYAVETANSDHRLMKIQIPDVSINCQTVFKKDDKVNIFYIFTP